MDQAKPAKEAIQTDTAALPGIEDMLKANRPQTSSSSATTVPPSSIPNTEDSTVPAPDVPIASLLSAVPATSEAPRSITNPKPHKGDSSQPPLKNGQTCDQGQAAKVNAVPAVESHVEESVRKPQKGKRRAPPQGRKAKRPRLGASQANLKKRTKAPTRRSKAVKSKKASTAQKAPEKGTENAQNTQYAPNETVNAGCNANEAATVTPEKVSDPKPFQLEVGEIDKIEKGSSQSIEKSNKCSPLCTTAVTMKLDGGNSAKDSDANHTFDKVTAEAERTEEGEQQSCPVPSSRESNGQQKDKDKGIDRTSGDNSDKNLQRQDTRASKETDTPDRVGSDAQEAAALREKYEDLSRRYVSLVRGLVQSACHEKGENRRDGDNEAPDSNGHTEVVDRKLYEAIYLCKVAGMLGAMKIEGGPSSYVRANRLRGVEDAYKSVLRDGFEFVEDLMKLGAGNENSSASVKDVFRDVHVRLVKDVWERNQDDKRGAKALLLEMMRMIGNQMRVWYMKIMDGEINVLWSQVIAVQLGEAVYKTLVKWDEELSGEVVSCLRDILKYISEYYQECERNAEAACLEKFWYSCEVSISIARSVPEAALTLEEEAAYAIGRHNGVFSHCVARLVGEREGKKMKN